MGTREFGGACGLGGVIRNGARSEWLVRAARVEADSVLAHHRLLVAMELFAVPILFGVAHVDHATTLEETTSR